MERLSPIFTTSPRTVNREVDHWLNNLGEVEKVIDSIEPKLLATNSKWKSIAVHNKETSVELCQVFDKTDQHYEVLLEAMSVSKKFEVAQQEFSKNDPILQRVSLLLRKYREEIQALRRECKERERLRERYDHYKLKLDGLEKKGKDIERIQRNQQKLKDSEEAYDSVTQELVTKMERCWKKHVSIFAECTICLWNIQFQMISDLSKVSHSLRPYRDQYCEALKISSSSTLDNSYNGNKSSDNIENLLQNNQLNDTAEEEKQQDGSSVLLDKYEKLVEQEPSTSSTPQYQTAKSTVA
ncbi:hypothetical protein GpartN1_g2816.t1 [Galdieria partita]|uniref:BAR domain-containing protein n=1 Tax=Galdieria partita TaxID=83374 RepID=A0A9C7PVE3_9RHOD|nr:hypothetical protein GpartN1_g2816.t1 [Galdieria partita]